MLSIIMYHLVSKYQVFSKKLKSRHNYVKYLVLLQIAIVCVVVNSLVHHIVNPCAIRP